MDANVINELKSGLSAAYINGSVAANLAYKPAFVSNNPEEGKKVISSVEDELLRCDQFQISVAFITMGGVTPLLQTLKELEEKGVKGQILTTNYLNFSEPRALEKLNGLKNITLKMYDVEAAGNGFHTKGYIFKKEEVYRIIIGSSNMTSDVTFEIKFHNGYQNAPQERQVAMRKKQQEEELEIRRKMTDDPVQCMELLLEWRGMKYTDLGDEIDRDPKTISRTVNGKTKPSVETLALICFGLHLPPVISTKLLEVFDVKLNPLRNPSHQWINEALYIKYPEPVWAVREYLEPYGVEI